MVAQVVLILYLHARKWEYLLFISCIQCAQLYALYSCIAVICFCICRVILKSAQYIAKALKENFLHDFDEQVSVLRN